MAIINVRPGGTGVALYPPRGAVRHNFMGLELLQWTFLGHKKIASPRLPLPRQSYPGPSAAGTARSGYLLFRWLTSSELHILVIRLHCSTKIDLERERIGFNAPKIIAVLRKATSLDDGLANANGRHHACEGISFPILELYTSK